ncbi:hypothetical protein EVAR_82168_1 [Eumeta japonica]|uniref:Uncharacterized protein n=1 Tax=Eumeta variegata TaxID=151549 RepID=A0A4C1U1Q3_EUMVA|nr:hypothetical protein EVAR_82168_1 [Eumeta japonica]
MSVCDAVQCTSRSDSYATFAFVTVIYSGLPHHLHTEPAHCFVAYGAPPQVPILQIPIAILVISCSTRISGLPLTTRGRPHVDQEQFLGTGLLSVTVGGPKALDRNRYSSDESESDFGSDDSNGEEEPFTRVQSRRARQARPVA